MPGGSAASEGVNIETSGYQARVAVRSEEGEAAELSKGSAALKGEGSGPGRHFLFLFPGCPPPRSGSWPGALYATTVPEPRRRDSV